MLIDFVAPVVFISNIILEYFLHYGSHLLCSILFSVLQVKKHSRKRNGITVSANRLTNPTTRNVMTGLLLSPGPVCNLRVIQSMSAVFMSAVNKSKFLQAASRLESASLGSVVVVPKGGHMFVKRSPEEMSALLLLKENQELCTIDEFQYRFNLPLPPNIEKIKGGLQQIGLLLD